jgi:hypothetical protein
MKQIIPFLIVGFFLVLFLLLRAFRPLVPGKTGILRRTWRKIVGVWDFITGFG